MHRRAAEEFERPFDLEAGPLVRARLVRLGDAAQVLLITAHHIVSDGWSTGVLVDDLVRIYDAYLHGRPSPLAPLSVQYADFASWQRQWLTGPVLDRQLDYWKRQLDGAPAVSELPTDRPRPAVQTFDGDTCTFALGPALSAGVKRLSERAGATTFMTMLAAFFVLLSRYTRQRDLVVGSPIAGRTRTELEPLVGFFLNTLVLRGDLSGDPTFRELVGRVRHAALDAYAHQDVPVRADRRGAAARAEHQPHAALPDRVLRIDARRRAHRAPRRPRDAARARTGLREVRSHGRHGREAPTGSPARSNTTRISSTVRRWRGWRRITGRSSRRR